MVAVVIFWSAAFAAISFVLQVIFETLASAIDAILTAMVKVLVALGIGAAVEVVLFVVYMIVLTAKTEDLWTTIAMIVMFLGMLVLGTLLIIFLGYYICNIVSALVTIIQEIISGILEWLAEMCEQVHSKCMKAIEKRLSRC